MPISALITGLMLIAGPPSGASDWPLVIESTQGTITIYQPQIDAYRGDTMSARAALSVSAIGSAEPVFGALWLDCRVLTERPARTVRIIGAKVSQIRFPEGNTEDTGLISAAIEEQIPGLNLTFSLEGILESLDTSRKENENEKDLEVAPPRIITRDHPAVLVLLDGEPVFVDVEGTSLRRVANTPYFIVQSTINGELFLKGGESWFSAREISGPWEVTGDPPADATRLAQRSESDARAGDGAPAAEFAPGSGKRPEIIVSTVPAELVATDGPVQFSPLKGTGLLYASNTPSKLFLLIASQDYYLLISGRWYTARTPGGPWSYIASERLPEDFRHIPPGSERDDVLASVAGTVPAREAILDAQVPQTAEVDRKQASTQVQYDGEPQFEPIGSSGMSYASNASTAVIRVGGRFYDCDRGVWFEGATPNGPWEVAVTVPPVIYTIPPRYPVYYVRYVRVYSYTPEVAFVGYTAGYTGCYVYNGTVVYGTGYYYRPWFRRYYYPRPWTWGFGIHYNPWTGWSMGYGGGWWRPRGWFAYNNWGVVREGWWGPVGYRPLYRPYAGPVYREGFRPVSRPLLPARAGRGAAPGGSRSAGPIRTTSMYDRWTTGVSRPVSGERPRQAVDMARPQGRPAQGLRGAPRVRQGRGARVEGIGKPARGRPAQKGVKREKERERR